jgi:hypothetical protein
MITNYLSDDEIEEPNNKPNILYTDELCEDELSEEELCEEEIEYLKKQHEILIKAAQKKSIFDVDIVNSTINTKIDTKKTKNLKEKNNNKLNIMQFNNFLEKEIKDLQPKKFVLKKNKRENDNSDITKEENNITVNKRQFNPRIPPYFTIYPRKYN